MNVFLAERATNQLNGTINAGGTLSNQLDLMGYDAYGLYYTGFVNGTMNFMVSDKPDEDSGVYVILKGSDGAAVAFGPTDTSGAVSGVVLEALRPYRYARVQMTAQASGAAFKVVMKA